MRKINCSYFILSGLLCARLFSAEIGMELLPKGRPFRLAIADPREVQMSLSFEGDSNVHANIGNYFSLVSFRPKDDSEWDTHFGLEGSGFFTMKQADHRFPLETADGLIGMYLETNKGPYQAQLRFTHISAHLADGSTDSPIAYSREFATLRVGWVPVEEAHVYVGIQRIINTTPIVNPWLFQTGGSYFLPFKTFKVVPFFATDFKWREESEFNPSWGFKAGIALNNPPAAFRSFRFYYAYYTGADPRGQYFLHLYNSHSFGIEMQI